MRAPYTTREGGETMQRTREAQGAPPETADALCKAPENKPAHLALKRVAVVAMLLVPLVAAGIAWALFGPDAFGLVFDAERIRAWVDAAGAVGRLLFVAAGMLQVVVAVLPGEPLELAAGYAFGLVEGTLLCLAASASGTAAVVLLTRRFGMRVVGLFFPPEKLASVRWLRGSRRFELLLFCCFLVPGTPKDLLTYVAGFSRVPAWRIVALTMLGRVPSVMSSTLAASAFAQGNWLVLQVTVAVTLVLVIVGLLAYRFVPQR